MTTSDLYKQLLMVEEALAKEMLYKDQIMSENIALRSFVQSNQNSSLYVRVADTVAATKRIEKCEQCQDVKNTNQ